jgi:ubiquinone biosynthesis protein
MFSGIRSVAELAHHLPRYREIVSILWKHGFGDSLRLILLKEILDIDERPAAVHGTEEPPAVRLRLALEELGPTFVKFGQVLSSRRDLLSDEMYLELCKLQDEVPPIEGERARAVVEAELGRPIGQLFSSFSLTSIGGGSIAQVHAAELPDGTKVAVKIQRPSIAKVIEVDVAILHDLAGFAEKHVPDLSSLNPVGVVQEFCATLLKELDFTHEAADAERFRQQFAGSSLVVVPRIYRDLTNPRVLTMEFLGGLNVKDPEKLRQAGIDPVALARRLVDLTFQQIFDFGFFHGDPHPGNMYILPNGVIGLIDYGMMGTLTHDFRSSLAQLLAGLARKDDRRVMDAILQISEEGYTLEPEKMLSQVEAFSDLNLNQSLKEINLGEVLNKLIGLLRQNKLRMKGAFYLGIKVFAQAENIGRTLDPDINLIELGAPYARRLILGRYKFTHLSEVLSRLATFGLDFLDEFPADFQNIYRRLKSGNVSLPIEHRINADGFEPLRKTLDVIANLIATAILASAFLICSSILILAHMPPLVSGVSLLGGIGLGCGLVLALRLTLHIWKHDGL